MIKHILGMHILNVPQSKIPLGCHLEGMETASPHYCRNLGRFFIINGLSSFVSGAILKGEAKKNVHKDINNDDRTLENQHDDVKNSWVKFGQELDKGTWIIKIDVGHFSNTVTLFYSIVPTATLFLRHHKTRYFEIACSAETGIPHPQN